MARSSKIVGVLGLFDIEQDRAHFRACVMRSAGRRRERGYIQLEGCKMNGMEGAVRKEELDASGRFPKLMDYQIESKIARSEFHVFGNKTTICVLYCVNGFHAVGYSSCVDPRNFNEAKGREIARQKAQDQLWELEGYLLQQREFERSQVPARF
jgi:hypothetical protein